MKAVLDIIIKNKTAQALIFLLVATVAVDGGFYLTRTAPATSEISELEGRLHEVEASTQSIETEYRRFSSFDSGREQLQEFKGLLPKRSEYTRIVKQVLAMAKDDRMKNTSFGTDKKEVEVGDFVEIGFSMPISGRYQDVRKFIHDAETSPLFLNINNLSLSSSATGGDINLTIALTTLMRS